MFFEDNFGKLPLDSSKPFARKMSVSKPKHTRNFSWNSGNLSSNARTDPWVHKYDFDDQGFKIYTHVEMNPSVAQTLEGSFTSAPPVDVTEDDFCSEYLTGRPSDETGFKPYWDFYLPININGTISKQDEVRIAPPNPSKKRSWKENISSMFSKPKILRVK